MLVAIKQYTFHAPNEALAAVIQGEVSQMINKHALLYMHKKTSPIKNSKLPVT